MTIRWQWRHCSLTGIWLTDSHPTLYQSPNPPNGDQWKKKLQLCFNAKMISRRENHLSKIGPNIGLLFPNLNLCDSQSTVDLGNGTKILLRLPTFDAQFHFSRLSQFLKTTTKSRASANWVVGPDRLICILDEIYPSKCTSWRMIKPTGIDPISLCICTIWSNPSLVAHVIYDAGSYTPSKFRGWR